MRRFSLYISVALVAFGIGSAIAYKFFGKANNKFVKEPVTENYVQTPKIQNLFSDTSAEFAHKRIISAKPFCHDERILSVWNELSKDKNFRDWVEDFHESINCSDMLEVKEIDLNQDNKQEIILRGKNFNLCSAVGNCAFWIYERTGKKYRKLLYSTDYKDATDLPNQIQKTKTNNHFDILLKGHFDASDTFYTYYNFNGRKYRENKCLVEAYVAGSSDHPRWEFITCKEFYKRSESER